MTDPDLTPETVPAEDWDQQRADAALAAALASAQTLRSLATTKSRRRVLAIEMEVLRRWHRERNPYLFRYAEDHAYFRDLWTRVPGVEEKTLDEW